MPPIHFLVDFCMAKKVRPHIFFLLSWAQRIIYLLVRSAGGIKIATKLNYL